jgi:hypothetical protein
MGWDAYWAIFNKATGHPGCNVSAVEAWAYLYNDMYISTYFDQPNSSM